MLSQTELLKLNDEINKQEKLLLNLYRKRAGQILKTKEGGVTKKLKYCSYCGRIAINIKEGLDICYKCIHSNA